MDDTQGTAPRSMRRSDDTSKGLYITRPHLQRMLYSSMPPLWDGEHHVDNLLKRRVMRTVDTHFPLFGGCKREAWPTSFH